RNRPLGTAEAVDGLEIVLYGSARLIGHAGPWLGMSAWRRTGSRRLLRQRSGGRRFPYSTREAGRVTSRKCSQVGAIPRPDGPGASRAREKKAARSARTRRLQGEG